MIENKLMEEQKIIPNWVSDNGAQKKKTRKTERNECDIEN